MPNELELAATGKLLHVKVTGKLTKEAYAELAAAHKPGGT
jgi:hypothetical protein